MSDFSYNAQFSTGNARIPCVVEDGVIYAIDFHTGKQPIGHTNDRYNALEETTVEYYNKLVEVGIIVPEKTSEEILQETQEALRQSQAANLEILQLLKELKGGNANVQHTNDTVTVDEDVSGQPKRNTGSSKTSKPSSSGSN